MYNATIDEIHDHAPEQPGNYYLFDRSGGILYIGTTNNIKKRLLEHIKVTSNIADVIHNVHYFIYIQIENQAERLDQERDHIDRIQPPFNDGGGHLYGADEKYLQDWQKDLRPSQEKIKNTVKNFSYGLKL